MTSSHHIGSNHCLNGWIYLNSSADLVGTSLKVLCSQCYCVYPICCKAAVIENMAYRIYIVGSILCSIPEIPVEYIPPNGGIMKFHFRRSTVNLFLEGEI